MEGVADLADVSPQKVTMGGTADRTELSGGLEMPFEENWWEFRQQDIQPERRGYHSTFVYGTKLFVYGGKDIQKGYMDNLWCIDLSNLQEFIPEESEYSPNP